MDDIAGLTPTGKRLRGPASDLVELNGEDGFRHTAVVFHDEYREHRALNESFEMVRGFLESPWVTGLVELGSRDGAAFVYPCGESWSVAEIIRLLADTGQVGGIRAGLELMYTAGQILIEAAENGESEGVYSHGGLTPWRVMLRRDGQVQIIGHALPQVEILMFHEDGKRIPREDSFRYCPPERIEQGPEDLSSDLFGLSLIAFELMTGRPVYDGLVNDIRQQAARGEGSRRLFRFRDKLPDAVRDCLGNALRRDTDDRFATGQDFLASVSDVLSRSSTTGSSLMDLMSQVTRQEQRLGSRPDNASTMMASVGEMQKMTAEADSLSSADAAPASQRWAPPPDRRTRKPRSPRSLRVSQQSQDEPPVIERLEPDPPQEIEPEPESAAAPAPVADKVEHSVSSAGSSEKISKGRVRRPRREARRPRRTQAPDPESMSVPAGTDASPTDASKASRMNERERVDAILGVSSAASSMVERVIRKRQEDQTGKDEPSSESAPPRFQKGRAPRRRAPPAPEASVPPEETAAVPVEDGTAPPLRSAPSPEAAVESPEPEERTIASPDAGDLGDEITAEVEISRSQGRTSGDVSDRTEAFTPEQLRERLEAAERAEQEAAKASAGTQVFSRETATPKKNKKPRQKVTLQVKVSESSDVEAIEVSGAQTIAELMTNWVGGRVSMRTDLMGRVKSWPRLRRGKSILAGKTQMSDVDVSKTLQLVWVANEERMVELFVGSGEKEDRMLVSMASAIPVKMLMEHLAEWLELGDSCLRLLHDGRVLSGAEILADLPKQGGRISLKLQRTEES
jgi:hypothetical protein